MSGSESQKMIIDGFGDDKENTNMVNGVTKIS